MGEIRCDPLKWVSDGIRAVHSSRPRPWGGSGPASGKARGSAALVHPPSSRPSRIRPPADLVAGMTINGSQDSVNIPQASARPWAFTQTPRLVNIRLEAHTRARGPNLLRSLSILPRYALPEPGSGLQARPPAAEADRPLHAPDLVLVKRRAHEGHERRLETHAADRLATGRESEMWFAGEIGQSLPIGQRYLHGILPSGFFCFV